MTTPFMQQAERVERLTRLRTRLRTFDYPAFIAVTATLLEERRRLSALERGATIAVVPMFTLTGRRRDDGRQVDLVWRDGVIVGNGELELDLQTLIDDARELDLTPTGPIVKAALTPADVALRTIGELVRIDELEGDVPELDYDVPDGAIA